MEQKINNNVLERVEKARKRLLDLTMKNSLLNFRHSDRAIGHIRIINSNIDELYKDLVSGKDIEIISLPALPREPEDEKNTTFQNAFELALVTDEIYLKEKAKLDKQDTIDDLEEKSIRELKNRVRERLGLPPLKTLEITKKEWAKENGIDPNYENSLYCNTATSSHKITVQTLLYPKELNSKISALKKVIKSDREEKGANTFYAALGFLEWYEQSNSEIKHFAPLLLIKLEDIKQDNKTQQKITFSSGEEPFIINFSLKEKLKEFNLNLPDFSGDDTPTKYFNKINNLIKSYPKWKIRNYITVGRFIFSRLAMYEDLNIENWKTLLSSKNDLLKALFDSRIDEGCKDIYDIDRDEIVNQYAPLLVASADSSQHSAIIDAIKGNNLVIKGPPGTGKSQTITNLIANALYANKKVLFMAEKKAALDVVFARLKYVGLEDFCLELHSDKTNISHLRAGLQKRLHRGNSSPGESVISEFEIEKLITKKRELRDYYDLLQMPIEKLNKTLYELVWQVKTLEKFIINFPIAIKNIQLENISKVKQSDIDIDIEALNGLENLYDNYLQSIENQNDEWNNIKSCSIKIQDIDNLLNQTELILGNIKDVLEYKNNIEKSWGLNIPNTLVETNRLLENLQEYNLFLEENKINSAWLEYFIDTENHEKIKNFINKIDEYNKLYTQLSKIYRNPLLSDDELINLEEVIEKLRSSKFFQASLEDVLSEKENIVNELENWNKNDKLKDISKLIYQKDADLSIGEICYIKDIIKEFIDAASLIPSFANNIDIFKSYNWNMLDEIEKKINNLHTEHEKLSEIFDMDFVLKIDDIRAKLSKLISYIKSSSFLSIFNADFRNAKSFYKSISLKIKQNKDTILKNSKVLLKYMTQLSEFYDNSNFSYTMSPYFKGVDTNINDMQKVRNLFEKISEGSIIYGEEITQKVYNYCTSKENFDSFQKIINLAKSYSQFALSSSLRDVNQLYNEYYIELNNKNIIISLLDKNFINLFINQKILIEDISKSILLLKKLQNYHSSIEIDNKLLPIIPNLTLGIQSDTSILKNILLFIEKIQNDCNIKNFANFIKFISTGILMDIIEDVKNYNDKTLNLGKKISDIEELFIFAGNGYQKKAYEGKSLIELLAYFEKLLHNKDAIYHICVFFDALRQAEKQRYGSLVSYIHENNFSFQNISNIYLFLVYNHFIKNIKNDKWIDFIPNKMKELTDDIRNLDNDVFKLNGKKLIQVLEKINIPMGYNSDRVSKKTELQLIKHQLSEHCRKIPIRRFIYQAGRAIQALKPCFLMSPIAVAQYIPSQSIEFDLLIIDEASQMYFEEALGGIFRSKQIVVVGDNNQLPPTPFFHKSNSQEDDHEENEDDAINGSSILDACLMQGFENRELLWHYRSKDSSLIAFSNNKFYNDTLNIFPTPVVNSEINGVQCCHVEGIYQNRQNEKEADAIIREIKNFVRCYPEKSLGIATINVTQKNLLEKKCELLQNEDQKFKEYCDKWSSTLESFFVKNLENVQGDERDYIFVSTVYGPETEDGRVLQRFGPINGKYGHRRLNVLFTRAKYGLKLFTSLKSEDIIVSAQSTPGVEIFRDYLLYAETRRIENGTLTERGFDSAFEKRVYDILTSKGYEIDKQVGVKGFFIDLAVKHPKNKAYYAVGIECDGAPYHSTKSARDRDCIRQSVLESLGWKIYRIWSTDWFHNTEKEIQKLLSYLDTISKEEPYPK